MQIAVIGLGRMDANISRRLMKAKHSCVVWDSNDATVQVLGKEGAQAVESLQAAVKAKNPKLDAFTGDVEGSGEGRWTIEAAIEEAVPANVLASSLFTRFRSRQDHTYGEKVLSAMRFGFGGHGEPKK